MFMNMLAVRCGVAPLPWLPYTTLPGLARMYSTSSRSELTGSSFLTIVTFGTLPITRDRHEVLGLVGQLLVEAAVDRERPGRRDEQRVPVGFGLRRQIGADVAAGAGLLLDDDRLAPLRLQLVGGDARQDVVDAAGRERHDELDRLARKRALRGRKLGQREPAPAQRKQAERKASVHGLPPPAKPHSGFTPELLDDLGVLVAFRW